MSFKPEKPLRTGTAKRGRRPKFYVTSWGEPIPGLGRNADGRWRIIATQQTFVEPDERLAVYRFRMWDTGQKQEEIFVPQKSEMTRSQSGSIIFERSWSPGEEFWPWLRNLLLTDIDLVARKTGIADLARLAYLPPPTVSPTMREVGKLYLDTAKISPNWRTKCKQFWGEFEASLGVTTLREVTQEHVVEYGDEILEAGQSPAYARQRFGAIKAMINYPTKRGKWAEDAKRALAYCAVLVPPEKAATDPEPITPSDFQEIFAKSDLQMRAALLLALNACMYAGEVAATEWSDLDLEKGTFITKRNKTKIVRIAILWPETITALRQLPRRSDAVFLTEAGTQSDYLGIYRQFKRARKAAELNKLQFSQIRDGSYTAAVEAGVQLDTCRLLAGHATGISDHYVKRRPSMVAEACVAIRNAYNIMTLPKNDYA